MAGTDGRPPPALSNPAQVVAGGEHACAIDDTGVDCWGRNNYGQTDVPALINPAQVDAGKGHTCAIDNTGVVCWGNNNYGQTSIPALSTPSQVATGGDHSCAIDNTGVVCWGGNGHGQTSVPVLSNPSKVTAGSFHTCAIDDTGVVCWGKNDDGQLNAPNPLSFSRLNPAVDAQITFIERFYLNILNRTADQGGLNNWLNVIQADSEAKVALGFLQSQELVNRKLDNSDFISILYETLFDRSPDQGGFDIWMSKLNSNKSREMVIYGFLRSQEFQNLADNFGVTAFDNDDDRLFQIKSFVERFYQLVLNREPDDGGFNDWSSQLANPNGTRTGGDIAIGFFLSPEFTNRQASDSEFLDIAYRSFFDRESDAGGKQNWINDLSLGMSRADVVRGFIGSQEFSNLASRFGIRAN